MATTASVNYGLFVYGNAVGLTTAVMARQSLGGMLYRPDALTARSGILYGGSGVNTGLYVAGTASTGTMTVTVSAGSCVITRSGANGSYLLTNPSTATIDVAGWVAARTDLVYIQHQDYAIDGTSLAIIGILTGSTGTPTTAPAVPTGAIALAEIYMPTSTTATNTATITQKAPFTAMAGGVVPVRTTTERDALSWKAGDVCYSIADNLHYDYSGSAWTTFGQSPIVYTPGNFSYPFGNYTTTPSASTVALQVLPAVNYDSTVTVAFTFKLVSGWTGTFTAAPSVFSVTATGAGVTSFNTGPTTPGAFGTSVSTGPQYIQTWYPRFVIPAGTSSTINFNMTLATSTGTATGLVADLNTLITRIPS